LWNLKNIEKNSLKFDEVTANLILLNNPVIVTSSLKHKFNTDYISSSDNEDPEIS